MTEPKRAVRPRYLDGAALRRKRLEVGLEQAELAERCGTTQKVLTHWERGDWGCRIGMLHKLAAALGCPPAELMLKDAATGGGENGAAA